MEYTRAKPWPFFMYKSLIAVNCSYMGGKGGTGGKTGHELCHMLRNVHVTTNNQVYKWFDLCTENTRSLSSFSAAHTPLCNVGRP